MAPHGGVAAILGGDFANLGELGSFANRPEIVPTSRLQ